MRRETPIIIPSPSETDEDSRPEPNEYTVCQGCRKKHRKCTHGSSVEPAERRGEPSTPPPHPGRISLIVHLKVAVGQVSKNIEIRQAPDNRRHPSEETKQVENTKVLDEELRNIAHEATMKALRSKLAEAERTEKTARTTLVQTQAQRTELSKRSADLRKQEERDSSAVVNAQRLINDLKRRLTKPEVRGDHACQYLRRHD